MLKILLSWEAGILEYRTKQNLTTEAQRGQISKVILGPMVAMSDIFFFSQRYYEQVIKVIHVHSEEYINFRKV